MAVPSSDKVLIGFALLLAIGSGVLFGVIAMRRTDASSGVIPQVELATTPYVPGAPEAPPVKTETWAAPVAQSRGRDWIYDTFTPPEIFYNARSKQFTVKPPSSLLDEDAQESFGLELITIRPEPFRLQLIGYVGGEGNWRGMFQNLVTSQVFLASGGHRVPSLALTVRSLDVSPHPIRLGESMTTRQRVATAVVRDEKAGQDITLTHRERVFTGTVFAFVTAPGEKATREVRSGDMFKIGEATYRIEKIETTPPAVEVVKESPTLSQPDRRVLTPREVDAEAPSEPVP
ncbi:MAG: hypothetical protein ACREH8_21245 [Opitutaceae bacterium]